MDNPKTIKPVTDRVIIKPHDQETTTATGFVIPDTAQKPPVKGTVISIGPDVKEFGEGDEVIYLKGHGVDFTIEGEPHLVMKCADVLMYIPNREARIKEGLQAVADAYETSRMGSIGTGGKE